MTAAAGMPPDAAASAAEITARSGSNFLAGFVCLAPERRRAMTVVYAFCRVVDDAVDDAPDAETARHHLDFWQRELEVARPEQATSPVGRELAEVVQRFGVPVARLLDLIEGCRTDIDPDGIADEAELERYCYRVASAVGLACLPILGADGDGARRFAVELGHALQLTNVLRDLRGDAEIGRCYVPRTWLAAVGLQSDDLMGRASPDRYVVAGPVDQLCRRLSAAARSRFANARRELGGLSRRERRALVAPRIMGAVYRELLVSLERRGGELLLPRARVGKARKLWLVALVWLGVRG